MSKVTFAVGSVTGGLDCARVAKDSGMFDTHMTTVFSCVFILAVSICGGLTALLIQEWLTKKRRQWNGRP